MSRLDQALVSRGLARSRTHAARLIAEGKVSSGGEVLAKASLQVPDDAALDVAASAEDGYVSRAGHKLAGALDAFPAVDVAGKRCLDAGASTGGFTDVLLRRGAAHVVAVDVGHGQLVPEIRNDSRVSVHEGLNVRYMAAAEIGGPAALTVADLSFISLTLVVAPLAACTAARRRPRPHGQATVRDRQGPAGPHRRGHLGARTPARRGQGGCRRRGRGPGSCQASPRARCRARTEMSNTSCG